jgi:hypothetical protein
MIYFSTMLIEKRIDNKYMGDISGWLNGFTTDVIGYVSTRTLVQNIIKVLEIHIEKACIR